MDTTKDPVYEFGVWRLEAAERRLLREGLSVPLTPKVFETLLLLVERAGTLVTKDEFMRRVWPGTFVEDLALVQNISQIRKALADASVPAIETVSKQGYRFVLTVRRASHAVEERHAEVLDISKRRTSAVVLPISGAAGQRELDDREFPHPDSNLAVAVADSEKARKHNRPVLTSIAQRPARLSIATRATIMILAAVLIGVSTWFALRRHPLFATESVRTQPVMVPLLDLPGEERMPALSPDGSRIAFVRQTSEPGKTGIYVEVVGTQSLLQLTNRAEDSEPAWSPDGKYIGFLRTSSDHFIIEIVPALGGPERYLYTGTVIPVVSPISLSFSPSGDELAFADWDNANQKSSIKLLSLSNLNIQTLTTPPDGYHDCAPQFSPDGSRVAFVRSTGPMFVDDLFVVPTRGGLAERITSDKRRIFSAPVWLDSGRELLFSSTRAGMKSLWKVPATGGDPVAIAGSGPGSDHPTYSPLTHALAYEYTVDDENLWRVSLGKAGETQQPLESALLSPKTSNLMAEFSPDGTRILFESDRSGYEEIWMCKSDGSDPVQITRLERYAGSPNWSPDGKSIVFDFRSSLHSGIYTLALAEQTPRPIAVSPEADNVVPSWSHDGQWIYFASNLGGNGFHVWKVKAKGDEEPQRVTRGEGFKAIESEDGRFIYYTRLADPQIRKVPRDGGPETLAEAASPDIWANWTLAGGGVFLLTSYPGQPSQLRFVNLSNGRSSTLYNLPKPSFYGVSVSPDGNSAVYSQRDRSEHDVVLINNFR